ncbi:MAG: hypothetical protein IJ816_00320 [Alloprevotella sp.]|nr:hypothetical protein [Alloprevotella sp.]
MNNYISAQTYTKIKSAEELIDGTHFIIVRDEDGASDFAFGYKDETYGRAIPVHVAEEKVIIADTDESPLVFRWCVEDGHNYIKLPSDEYFVVQSTNVYLSRPTKNSTSHWNVDFVTEINTELSCENYKNYPIKFITSSNDFRCYKSGAKVVSLYKLDGDFSTAVRPVFVQRRPNPIFDLFGRFCGYDFKQLSPGVYIFEGKKILKE